MNDSIREEIAREVRSEFGRIGARARAASLSPERRSAIAKKAAKASAKVRKSKARNRKKER